MTYIKAFFRWFASKDNYSNIILAIRVAKSIYSKNGFPSIKKIESLKRAREIAQQALDISQVLISNNETDKWISGINASRGKDWGIFTAEIKKNENGNNTINLGVETDIKGIPFSIGYDGGVSIGVSL